MPNVQNISSSHCLKDNMPQAPQHLRDKFEDDGAAWAILDKHYYADKSGVIHPKDSNRTPTPEEGDALDYLWLEWDYGYSTITSINILKV